MTERQKANAEARFKAHPVDATSDDEAVRKANEANPPSTVADVIRNSRARTAKAEPTRQTVSVLLAALGSS